MIGDLPGSLELVAGRAIRAAACIGTGAIALTLVLAGCSDSTDGNPVGSAPSGTEPDFPTTRPSRTTSTTPPAPPTSATPVPAGPEALAPQNGYVYLETKSGLTRCQLNVEAVSCEAEFEKSPSIDGFPANGVNLNADGAVTWVSGNLGDIPTVPLDYRTYTALGWTIEATEAGTRFTNDGTGHGMLVRIEGVETY
ncbi:hypothetical protein [Mycobacterium sp. Root265]|uniref:hypothetical protein n=1 Tax=Mycobacterium sp. Root265 TaxID=1736504 RepID=UPI000B0D0B63|nr:hypothetical protein [Mycobacterium sp. Root265]